MDENLELLECIYQNADMGTKTLTDLLNELKESKELLKKNDTEPKGKGVMADMMSKMGIKREVIMDNSDSAIAEMLIEGFTMGNLELSKLIDSYKDQADKKILKLAKELQTFGENEIKKLNAYL